MTSEEARAVAETMKLGQELTKAGVASGGYLARTFGSIPGDLLGIAGGDWLAHQRRRNLHRLEMRTEALLEGVPVGRRTAPSPSLLIPLLQGAADESREGLQEMWAALLARAMIDDGRAVRRAFFETVRAMEPEDAAVLVALGQKPKIDTFEVGQAFSDQWMPRLGITKTRLLVAMLALDRLGCLENRGDLVTARISVFGRELLQACDPNLGPDDRASE